MKEHVLYIVDYKYPGGEWESDIMAFKDREKAVSRANSLPFIHKREEPATVQIITLKLVEASGRFPGT